MKSSRPGDRAPVPITASLRAVLREAGQGHRGIHAEIWARWSDIVGPHIARRVVPRKLSDKTLLLAAASSSWMQELALMRPRILERIAEEIGGDVVTDIRFAVDSTIPFDPIPGPSPECPPPRPAALPGEVSAAVSVIADPELRDSIERAAGMSIARTDALSSSSKPVSDGTRGKRRERRR